MKILKLTAILAAAGVFFSATLTAQPGADAGERFSDEELMKTYGFLVASQVGINHMDLSESQFEAFLDGFRYALENTEPPHAFEEVGQQLQAFLEEKQAAAGGRAAEAGREEAAGFFAELAERDDVERTETGLFYEVVEMGDGDVPGPNDTVRIHYRGSLITGETFDSSYERGEPAEFPVTGVIPGMSEALQMLPVGTEAILYIPSDLGYGDRGAGNIPPGATLIFEIEMLAIVD